MSRTARRNTHCHLDPAPRWVMWLLVGLLPWLLSGIGQSVLHSANCPDSLLSGRVVSHSLSVAAHSPAALTHQSINTTSFGEDDLCLTSLWATQAIGMQVATVPLTVRARTTAPLLPPVFLVSGVALPRGCIIRGPPVTEFSLPVV